MLSEIGQKIKEIEEMGMSIAASSPVTENRALDSSSNSIDECQASCIVLGQSLITMSESWNFLGLETTIGYYTISGKNNP